MSFSLKKVLISDEVSDVCTDILETNGIQVVKKTKLSKEELIEEIKKDYDGLIVRSATKVTADVIVAGSELKIIGRAGTGVDNIDCDAATKQGVIVMNTPGGNTLSAAEHTCAMIMALSRHIPQGHESMRASRWDRKKFMGNEVYGKTLAIIGLGRIGKEVATRMQAFGMTTIGYDPIISAEESAEFSTEWLPLEQIWPRADYITVHTPLIPQTRNLINFDVLSRCKKGVRLVNVARGGIIDEEGIIPAIEKGYCGGAALDVFVQEPPTNSQVTQHASIICTPHLGASTHEAQVRVAEEIAQQFVDLSRGKSLFGAINAHALTDALGPATKPWVDCGMALGSLAAMFNGKVDKQTVVRVITKGGDAQNGKSYLSAAVLCGLLKSQSDIVLNMINAPAFAKQLGVQISTGHEEDVKGHHRSVIVTVQQENGPVCSLTGYTHGNVALLKALNGQVFCQAVSLTGNLLFYTAENSPNVMPAVAGILGEADAMATSFSRTENSSMSWNVMNLPKLLSNLNVLRGHVTNACQIAL